MPPRFANILLHQGEDNILRLTAYLMVLVIVAFAVKWIFFPIDTDRRHAWGCFVSPRAGPILIGQAGIHLPSKNGILVSPYKLEWAKGYQISGLASVSLVSDGGGYIWERSDRGWSYNFRFEGPGGFIARGAVDPEKLNAFHTRDSDGNRIDFVRSENAVCKALQ